MDQHNPNHWRQMFERGPRTHRPDASNGVSQGSAPDNVASFSFDDGYDPARDGTVVPEHAPLSHEDLADEAAMALALDPTEYRPWILQRGRTRPAMMLHLRRYDPRSRLWQGWQVSYPHLIAVEYTGDTMLSLDFGSRQFVIEGRGLTELSRHLQSGSVMTVTEYTPNIWTVPPVGGVISALRLIAPTG